MSLCESGGCMCLCVYIDACMCVCLGMYVWRSEDTLQELALSTLWTLEFKLRWADMVASTFTP